MTGGLLHGRGNQNAGDGKPGFGENWAEDMRDINYFRKINSGLLPVQLYNFWIIIEKQ